MNRREIEELARSIAEEVGRAGVGAQESSHEVASVNWRMPVQGQSDTRSKAGVVGRPWSPREGETVRIADLVDHTLLKAEATRSEIDKLCDEARTYGFASVCVNGCWVSHCAAELRGTAVMVATVVGFPLGAMPSRAKACETKIVIADGADEVDMVAPIGHILDEDWDAVEADIALVVDAAGGKTVKVILETATLQPLQIVKSSVIAREAGANFVKTSTGFHPAGGATAEAVAIMRMAVGDALGVKAAGGIRDCAAALRMLAAGATRLGTSSGVKFVECIGTGPVPIRRLLDDPDAHDRVCRTGSCPGLY